MIMKSIKCPDCGGSITMDIKGQDFIFCPYCGSQIEVIGNKKESVKTKNININKNINIHKTNRKIDDAEIINAKMSFWKEALPFLVLILMIVIPMTMLHLSEKDDEKKAQIAQSEGKISAGWHGDYEDQNYESVEKQFEAMGFTNIETIDAKDWNILKNNKVQSISIGGDSNFSSSDYFDPDVKVIITYY